MAATKNTTYLITGANRGLGRGYVETYLSRPNTTVLAAVRDPAHPTSQALSGLPIGEGSTLHLVKFDASIQSDAAAAIEHITTKLNIPSLDVVIANHGIVGTRVKIAEVTIPEINEILQVNTYSVIGLFQAARKAGLLKPGAKFIPTGSGMGSIGMIDNVPFYDASYGISKVAIHWIAKKLQQENPELIVFLLDPGMVATDMGIEGAKAHLGVTDLTGTMVQGVEETVAGAVDKIDSATREGQGGKYVHYNGADLPW